jgi:membrane protein YdbS with pleckstrin-like domain
MTGKNSRIHASGVKLMVPSMVRSAQPEAVLMDRPVTRRAVVYALGLGAITLLCAAIFGACMLQSDPGASSWTWASGIASSALMVITIGQSLELARLYSERYVVTTEAIEITSGILRRDSQKIPFSNILDVTSNSSFDRRLFGIGNITVAIANGDHITLEDVSDPQSKTKTLWNLVHKR